MKINIKHIFSFKEIFLNQKGIVSLLPAADLTFFREKLKIKIWGDGKTDKVSRISTDIDEVERPLFFTEVIYPGGAQSVMLALAKEYKRQGVHCGLATLSKSGWLIDEFSKLELPVYYLPSESKFDIGLCIRLAKLIRKKKYLILHSHLLDSYFYGSIAAFLARVPHVATEHGDVHYLPRKKFLQLKIGISNLFNTNFCAVSEFSAKRLLELGATRKRVHVFPNPIFDFKKMDSEIKKSNDVWHWLNIGNLLYVKGQETLLRAFKECLKLNKKKQILTIVGEGDQRERLEKLVVELNIKDFVKLVGRKSSVEEFLSEANAFILSSLSEAMPMTILEAGNYHLPVIATNVGGIPEIIENEKEGLLVETKDYTQLANAMSRLIDQPELAQKISDNLESKVKSNFKPEIIAKKYISFYQALRRKN